MLFRADSIGDAQRLIGRIFALTPGGVHSELLAAFDLVELTAFSTYLLHIPFPALWACVFFAAACWFLRGRNAWERMRAFRPGWKTGLVTAALLTWCVFSFSGVSTFLYFNF